MLLPLPAPARNVAKTGQTREKQRDRTRDRHFLHFKLRNRKSRIGRNGAEFECRSKKYICQKIDRRQRGEVHPVDPEVEITAGAFAIRAGAILIVASVEFDVGQKDGAFEHEFNRFKRIELRLIVLDVIFRERAETRVLRRRAGIAWGRFCLRSFVASDKGWL